MVKEYRKVVVTKSKNFIISVRKSELISIGFSNPEKKKLYYKIVPDVDNKRLIITFKRGGLFR